MKKIFILMMALMMSFSIANAQIATENAKLFDNVYVSVGGGVATPLDFDEVMPLNPLATVTVGKQFTPVFGAEVEGTAWFGSHANGTHDFGVPHFDNQVSHNAIRGSYVGANGTVNLTNLFKGYRGAPRPFEVGLVTGLGWVHTFVPGVTNKADNYLGAKTGFDLAFNLGKSKAHTLSVRPAVLWNLSVPGTSYGNLAFNRDGAQLNVNVAYTYHFRTSNGTRYFRTYDVGAMNDEINRLREELAKKPKEITNTVIEKKTEYVLVGNSMVFFEYDSDVLDNRAKETLDKLSNNTIYNVFGYASSEGTTEYNKALSLRRAQAVADYLKGKGVKVNDVEGRGVQFGKTTGRVVEVVPNK